MGRTVNKNGVVRDWCTMTTHSTTYPRAGPVGGGHFLHQGTKITQTEKIRRIYSLGWTLALPTVPKCQEGILDARLFR